MLSFDMAISVFAIGCRDATERSQRTPDEAAAHPHPDDRCAGRQYEKGGGALEHLPTRHLQIDCGTGTHPSACGFSTATHKASSRPNTVAPCSSTGAQP